MQAMVSCCPALACLTLGPHLAVSTAAPLQQLTGLTDLSMCASFQDNAPSVAELTDLQYLVLMSSNPGDLVTVSGLLQLTMLQQLQGMLVASAACDRSLATSAADPGRVTILNKVRTSAATCGGCLHYTTGQQARLCASALASIDLPCLCCDGVSYTTAVLHEALGGLASCQAGWRAG